MSENKKSFREFFEEMRSCEKCALRGGCSQVVPGDGNTKTDIMFIGEAPGQKEDELGVPFVGAAGNLLNEMLGSINLKREDIYIANIIKCRPPGNRDPLPPEIEACTPWLVEQIKRIDPKLIITLGRYSMNFFCPSSALRSRTGMFTEPRRRFSIKNTSFLHSITPPPRSTTAVFAKRCFKILQRFRRFLKKLKKKTSEVRGGVEPP